MQQPKFWFALSAVLCAGTALLLPGVVSRETEQRVSSFETPSSQTLVSAYGRLPLSFEVNQGQTDERVKFMARGGGYTLFLTGNQAVLSLKGSRRDSAPGQELKPARIASTDPPVVLRMSLVGANTAAKLTGLDELPGKSNYFIGNDPRKWRINVANYAKVKYENIYPGVDLVYYGNQGKLEYDFVVQPGADPNRIALDVGAGSTPGRGELQGEPPRIDGSGDLVIEYGHDQIRFGKPLIYQPAVNEGHPIKHFIAGNYAVKDGRISFYVAIFDKTRPLVIDPTLTYSTYLGGSNGDEGNGVAFDVSGHAYISGYTQSADFPTTPGAFQTVIQQTDAFVTKLNAVGSALIYSTYLGGSNSDIGRAIAVDASGNAYVTGATSSSDFPTTPGAFQTALAGSYQNAFVTKLNATGSGLLYSSYLGGSNDINQAYGIAIDTSDNAYVAGTTDSSDFPTTPGAFQTTLVDNGTCLTGVCPDSFVTKVNATGSALVYSTYLGGSGQDYGYSVALNPSADAYVIGVTSSSDFPVTPGAFETTGGGTRAFVSEFNASGSGLIYSTYLGGLAYGQAIAVDSVGNAYATGFAGAGFPTTPGAFQTTSNGGYHAFVTKLNPAGSALVFSTYLGGTKTDNGLGIAVRASGNAVVTGFTFSSDFPTTSGAFQTTFAASGSGKCPLAAGIDAGCNAFVTELNSAASGLVYSTYLGGSIGDGAQAIAVDALGEAYVTGSTFSPDFPTTSGAFQTTFIGKNKFFGEAFVAKFDFGGGVTLTPPSLTFATQAVGSYSPAHSATLKNGSGAALNIAHIYWPTGDYDSTNNCPSTLLPNASCTLKVTFTPTSPGTRLGAVTIADNAPGSPQKLSLSGTGSGTGSIMLRLSPASLSFGSVAVGTTSSPQTLTVTNVGNVAANFSSPFTFETGGKDCGDFHKNPQCGTTLAPNASCEVTIAFKPTTTGTRTGIFVVHQGAQTRSITLSGTGTP